MTAEGYAFIDSFTALPELTRKQQRDHVLVLRALSGTDRFSVFDATETQEIARTMTAIESKGWIKTNTSIGYPWVAFEITDVGRAEMGAGQ